MRVEEGHGETTLVVEPARADRGLHPPARRGGLQLPLGHRRRRLPRLGRRRASPATSAPPPGRDLNMPMTQGLQALPTPKPKRFSVSYHLLSVSDTPRRVRVQTWVDDGEPVPSVIAVWPTADWHEREAFDLMGIVVRRPPEPEADPHRRRLGGPPAAQGLPDRRRAGPLLGGRVMAIAPERTRAAIYEGTRIPHPVPTLLRVSDELARDRRRAADQLRAEPSLDPRRAAPDRRPLRRGRRRARGGRSATSTRASRRTWSRRRGGRRSPIPERIDYLSFQAQRARLRARDREAARARDAAEGRLDAHAASAS